MTPKNYKGICYGTIGYYQRVAAQFDTILSVEISDTPNTINVICRSNHDKSQIKKFAEELEPGVGYEIIEVDIEDWIEKQLEEKKERMVKMSDKKYTCFTDLLDNGIGITMIYKDGEELAGDKICEELNALHEENQDLTTKKEDAEYELIHLKEKYEELLEEKERYKKEMLYFKRELQKELVCEAIIEGRKNN